MATTEDFIYLYVYVKSLAIKYNNRNSSLIVIVQGLVQIIYCTVHTTHVFAVKGMPILVRHSRPTHNSSLDPTLVMGYIVITKF